VGRGECKLPCVSHECVRERADRFDRHART